MSINQLTISYVSATLLVLGAMTQPAAAETCSWQPATDYDANYETDVAQNNADIWFNAFHCMQGGSPTHGTLNQYYWDKFGFEDDYWRNGFGWENVCDHRLPLSRMMSAIFILQNSYTPAQTSWTDLTGPLVRWAYGYAAKGYNDLDDLRAGCYGDEPGTLATTSRTPLDDYTTFWLPFFTKENVVGRAPVLFHESLHYRTGDSHTCGKLDQYFYGDHYLSVACTPQQICDSCTRAGCNCRPDPVCLCTGGRGPAYSCTKKVLNPAPSRPSVHGWTTLWLASYALEANASTNPSMKTWAKYLAKARAQNRFCTPSSVPAWILNLI